MANSDEILQAYINRMLTLQDEKRDKPFTQIELKQMALDMGMSEEDWLESQKTFQANLKSGQGHLMYQNWQDAIKELESAVALNPNSLEAAYGLAKAYQGRWNDSKSDFDRQQAEKFAELALQIQPGHQATAKVLKELRQGVQEVEKTKKTYYWLSIGATVVVGLIAFFAYTSTYNAVIAKKEIVKQKWAQVENVYQRRADLIPKLVSALKSERNFEQNIVDKLGKLKNEISGLQVETEKLSEEDLAKFQSKQSELSNSLNQIFAQSEKYPELRASQVFRDLQIQVEGSENRISVERKKFNEAVSEYNAYIKQFPNSMLNFKDLTYFKMEKGAKEKGELGL